MIGRYDHKSSLGLSPKSIKYKKFRLPFQVEFGLVSDNKSKSPKVDDNNSGRESKFIKKSGRAVYEPMRFEP